MLSVAGETLICDLDPGVSGMACSFPFIRTLIKERRARMGEAHRSAAHYGRTTSGLYVTRVCIAHLCASREFPAALCYTI